MTLTQATLKSLLHYDPLTGRFFWRSARGRVRAGEEAGNTTHSSYRRIRILTHEYFAHRLAWLYMTGKWPVEEIDHIDGNRSNNKWTNLRAATRSQNHWNAKLRSDNTSGYKGAHRFRKGWVAHITYEGRMLHLGCFDTPEAAHAAYLRKARELFGEFARPA